MYVKLLAQLRHCLSGSEAVNQLVHLGGGQSVMPSMSQPPDLIPWQVI